MKDDKKKAKKAAKQEIKVGKGEVATTAETEAPKKKSKEFTPVETTPRMDSGKPNLAGLPKAVTEHRINGKSTISDGVQKVTLAEIMGTSKVMYVDDIHSGQPVILQTAYWLNTTGQRWPICLVEEDDYNFVHQHGTLPMSAHLISVIDCAVIPTLSYGFRLNEFHPLPFPTLQQIALKDKDFRNNPTYFHNRKPILIIEEKEALKVKPPVDEDDDFIIDDDASAEVRETADEEFEFTDD